MSGKRQPSRARPMAASLLTCTEADCLRHRIHSVDGHDTSCQAFVLGATLHAGCAPKDGRAVLLKQGHRQLRPDLSTCSSPSSSQRPMQADIHVALSSSDTSTGLAWQTYQACLSYKSI